MWPSCFRAKPSALSLIMTASMPSQFGAKYGRCTPGYDLRERTLA